MPGRFVAAGEEIVMRSNSGSGKSNNNLHDPTLKEHEQSRRKVGGTPAHGRAETAEDSEPDDLQRSEAQPAG